MAAESDGNRIWNGIIHIGQFLLLLCDSDNQFPFLFQPQLVPAGLPCDPRQPVFSAVVKPARPSFRSDTPPVRRPRPA